MTLGQHWQFEYRINLIDARGTISLLSPSYGPKMITAAAGLDLPDNRELLRAVAIMDQTWAQKVMLQLARFDEFNTDKLTENWGAMIDGADSAEFPAFRVIDAATRARSLMPARLGLILVNLPEHRIIQVQNHGFDIERRGEGRYRLYGQPQKQRYSYSLPEHWTVLP